MRHALQCSIPYVLTLMLGLGLPVMSAAAENAPEAVAAQDVNEPIRQIKLTEAQVKNFIAAQPDLALASRKMPDGVGELDAAMEAELDAIAKKHGFSGIEELDDVSANIILVMTGFNPETGKFIEPSEAIKKEIEFVKASTAMPAAEKKERLEYLTQAMKTIGPLEHKENVDLVKAHMEEIEKALE